MKQRIVSGMRTTGKLHLGHLYSVLSNWVKLQNEFECFMFIADWHAMTTDYKDMSCVYSSGLEIVADWLAAGLDPEKVIIFKQSDVIQHAELMLLLSMVTPVPWLERVPSYKELKNELRDKELSTLGFLGYPVLQTADIILYKGNKVPVGDDQLPHVELSREIVRKFNGIYGNIFPEPEGLLQKISRVPGLDGRKMSKSYSNAIYLSDNDDSITKKIGTALTDSARARRKDSGNPNNCNLFSYHKMFTLEEKRNEIIPACKDASIGCFECKSILTQNIIEYLQPFRLKRARYENASELVKDILNHGAKKARAVAEDTMKQVRNALKLTL